MRANVSFVAASGSATIDFIEAENSMGFHADQEAARVLGNAMNHVRIGEATLRGQRVTITRSPVRPAQLVTPQPRAGESGAERTGAGGGNRGGNGGSREGNREGNQRR